MSPPRRSGRATEEMRAGFVALARRIVGRDGPDALTMRALAAEAGCAVGLPYKVFSGRDELVSELVRAEFRQLRACFDELVAAAGTGTVGGNLSRFARLLLDAPVVSFAHHPHSAAVSGLVDAEAEETGVVAALEGTVAAYLAAEKRCGRVGEQVDERAFAFLVAGAVHNLLASGPAYPRPTAAALDAHLAAVADRLGPDGPPGAPPSPCHDPGADPGPGHEGPP